ncbi:MAG TPA: hypothetical protein VM142_09090 [Acidimicrobiales bacterium]|nr:hypothetical protein [Acidimicrobiales bacterium]
MTQAAVSAIERAWDGDRRREFDAHELLIFAMVFDLPIIWFLLPPPGDHRVMRSTTRQVDELYAWLLGRLDQLELLLALLNDHADSLDNAVDELGRWVDHLRQVGIRGFIAEHTNDADFARSGLGADEAASGDSEDQPASGTQSGGRPSSTSTIRPRKS